jgi:hypothetical protein
VTWPLAWELDSWSNERVGGYSSEPARTLGADSVRIRYQGTTSDDTEDFVRCIIVIFIVCKSVRLL